MSESEETGVSSGISTVIALWHISLVAYAQALLFRIMVTTKLKKIHHNWTLNNNKSLFLLKNI